ncbi:hypothetical protein WMY93_020334 [Mugilogobius chulae]|uniref:INTS6/SAGE1/DDX26B/CT45 C-terminal domain-containing protein n=1 Tax=Mugilogobius chulae TaxID=88201 RepID=A0AAW0NNN7_9GOBI
MPKPDPVRSQKLSRVGPGQCSDGRPRRNLRPLPPPDGVAGWKENHATFMCELKNLQASGLTTLGHALRTAFDLLNLNRLVSGIDNYGQGRNPFFLEPSIIITITDGNKLTHSSGVPDELHLPLNSPLAGSELTKEPFRWDQRLFALVLRLPGAAAPDSEQLGSVPNDDSAITQMCEVTGGRSYSVLTQRMLNQCLESLVQKVQSGVVINFEKTGPDPPPLGEENSVDSRPVSSFAPQPWHSCHKLIYVRPNPKQASRSDTGPSLNPFGPTRTPHSERPGTSVRLPQSQHHLTCVNLFVMPYNYPVLLPLLDDLFKVHKLKPNLKWRQAFEMYLKTMPPYYLLPLKKAMRMMGAPNLIADNLDCGLSYSVISYLKKLSQQAKIESDRLIVSVGKKAPQETGIKVKNHSSALSLAIIGLLNKDVKPQAYRNAYDIPRRNLLDQLTRMRSNLLRTSQKLIRGQDEDYLHSIPVAQMGNYQEYLKMMPSPLREIDPDQPKRLHTFGNPFKQDKKGMMIDEADEFVAGPQNKKRVNSETRCRPRQWKQRTGEQRRGGLRVWRGLVQRHRLYCCKPDLAKPEGKSEPGSVVVEPEPESGESEERTDDEGFEEPLKEKYNCDRLSPQSSSGSSETEPETLQTVYIPPLDGTQAELRTRVIKEVRKPGRNYEAIMRLLHEVKGPVNVQKYFLLHASKRFKKRVLIQQLEQVLSELEDPLLVSPCVPSSSVPNEDSGKS